MTRLLALTGATGFIGAELAKALVKAGFQVRVLERSPSGAATGTDGSLQRVRGDLADDEALARLVAGTSAVIHCAGTVRGVGSAPFFSINADGSERLARIVAERPEPPRFLLISSLAAREPQLSPYAASKRAAEDRIRNLGNRLSWAALRPPPVYGPGDRALVPLLDAFRRGWAPMLAPPEARLSLLHVSDLVSAVEAWLHWPQADGGIYELHDGQPGGYSWDEVLGAAARRGRGRVFRLRIPATLASGVAALNGGLARATGRAPVFTPGKLREIRHLDWVCDNTAINQAMDWHPRLQLEEGLDTLFPSRGGSAPWGPEA